MNPGRLIRCYAVSDWKGIQMETTDFSGATWTGMSPLSLNQEFVSLFDQGSEDGPFGPRYHAVAGWRITGEISLDALREALRDIVVRHEALRTLITAEEGGRYQQVCPPTAPELEIRDFPAGAALSRERQAEAFIQAIETETISPDELPLLRAVLARYDDRDAVLALMTHHLASDGLSMRVLIRDLANRYAARTGHSVPDLPPAPQYREYASWQREGAGASTDTAREYWRRKLEGALFTAIPTDFARSARLPESTGAHRFLIPADVVSAIDRMSSTSRTTRFMTMAAMYQLLVHRLTGATDVVTATFTPGRGGQLFQETVGSFFNFVPLRTDIAGCTTFRELLERTRRTCLEAFSHDMPSMQIFAEAPELMRPAMADSTTAVVFQSFDQKDLVEAPGDLKYTRITRLLSSQPRTSSVPDGALWSLTMDLSGDAVGVVSYKRNLFREDTIASMAAQFQDIARVFSTSPGASPGLA